MFTSLAKFLSRWFGGSGDDADSPAGLEIDGRKRLGRAGEEAAARWLKKNGYNIVARNVELRTGEIDIVAVARREEILAIVEVRTRRGCRTGVAGGISRSCKAKAHSSGE